MSIAGHSQLIWNRIVAPEVADMPPEAARFFVAEFFAG